MGTGELPGRPHSSASRSHEQNGGKFGIGKKIAEEPGRVSTKAGVASGDEYVEQSIHRQEHNLKSPDGPKYASQAGPSKDVTSIHKMPSRRG